MPSGRSYPSSYKTRNDASKWPPLRKRTPSRTKYWTGLLQCIPGKPNRFQKLLECKKKAESIIELLRCVNNNAPKPYAQCRVLSADRTASWWATQLCSISPDFRMEFGIYPKQTPRLTTTLPATVLLCVDNTRLDSSPEILQKPCGRRPEMIEHMDRTRLVVSQPLLASFSPSYSYTNFYYVLLVILKLFFLFSIQ